MDSTQDFKIIVHIIFNTFGSAFEFFGLLLACFRGSFQELRLLTLDGAMGTEVSVLQVCKDILPEVELPAPPSVTGVWRVLLSSAKYDPKQIQGLACSWI